MSIVEISKEGVPCPTCKSRLSLIYMFGERTSNVYKALLASDEISTVCPFCGAQFDWTLKQVRRKRTLFLTRQLLFTVIRIRKEGKFPWGITH